MARIFARTSVAVTNALAGLEPVIFDFGQERLEKCFVIEFGMNRVRWA
jgi:hypothetical protein